ncbi:peptidase inhibitor family I36 protein [Streptomyces xantholiticus]
MRKTAAKLLTGVALTAIVGVTTSIAPAAAAPSEHCQEGSYCLFDGIDFTGNKAAVPNVTRCHTVSSLGISAAHSAARGYGDSKVLVLYSDTQCSQEITDVTEDRASLEPAALSYLLMNLPS